MNKSTARHLQKIAVFSSALSAFLVLGIFPANASGYVTWNSSTTASSSFSQEIQTISGVAGVGWKSQVDLVATGNIVGVVVIGLIKNTSGYVAELRVDSPVSYTASAGTTCALNYDPAVQTLQKTPQPYAFCSRPFAYIAGDRFRNDFIKKLGDATNSLWDASITNETTGITTQLGEVQIAANSQLGGVLNYTYTFGFVECSQAEPTLLAIYSHPIGDQTPYSFSGTSASQCGKLTVYQPSSPNYDNRVAIQVGATTPTTNNYQYSLDEILNPDIWTNAFAIASKVSLDKYAPILAANSDQIKVLTSQADALHTQIKALTDAQDGANAQISSLLAKDTAEATALGASAKTNTKLTQCLAAAKKFLSGKFKGKLPFGC